MNKSNKLRAWSGAIVALLFAGAGAVSQGAETIVIGPVEALGPKASYISVLGQTFRLSGRQSPIYRELSNSDSEIVGLYVLARGEQASNGHLVATSIERLEEMYIPGASIVYFRGELGAVDASSGLVQVGRVPAYVSQAISNSGDLKVIAGQEIELVGVQPVANGPIWADEIVPAGYSTRAIVGTGKQSQAIVGTGKETQAIVGTGNEAQAIVGTGASTQAIVGTGKQTQAIVGTGKQAQAIVGTGASTQAIVGTGKQSQAIVGTGKQAEAIVGTGASTQAIVGTGKQTQAIVGTGKQADAIVGTGKQLDAIVGIGASTQAIVGTGKQTQAIVGTGKQLDAIVGTGASTQAIVGTGVLAY